MNELAGKVALVTGAAGALGGAVVAALAQAGATLALTDHHDEKLRRVYPRDYPDGPWRRACDLADGAAVATLVDDAVAAHGHLDLLINCHGVYRGGTPLHETPLAEWDALMDANARSVFHTCRAAVPHLLRAAAAGGSGRIVNVGARAALAGSAGSALYIASKSAVVRLTESLAAELRERGVGVNCVLPGTIDTPANRAARPGADASRWVSPAAIADVILFLCSTAARAVHGAAIPVYGLS
ncbi:MAG TPA: SDR family NAD(P)-dependent oxidoreductase [Thermoanaerobaculia bacterium]|jgi:NAD(P)-dependent dehydrogenase (short-subunit alcohol dehydrogenase family)|nr:SDR family NAD(P)-dependent oxidoreductase [Thermoanaerobaculia bacterium]